PVVSAVAAPTTTATPLLALHDALPICTQGSLSATNYTFSFVGGTLTVGPATLTVTADPKSKVYGAGNPSLTYTITGFVNGDPGTERKSTRLNYSNAAPSNAVGG